MRRPHIFRNLHTALLLSLACALLGGILLLWQANRTGFPESWRARLEQELGKQGAHLTIGAIRYIPFKGIVASDVRIFSDPARLHELSRLEHILLAIDRTKLARGQFRLTRIELNDADISLPVDPRDPSSEILQITGASGIVSMPGGRLLEIRDARGRVAGIDVIFGARLLGYRQDGGDPGEDPDEGTRREFLSRFISLLEDWRFHEDHPPQLRVFAEGDLADRSSIGVRMSLLARNVERSSHPLDEVSAQAVFSDGLLTVTSLRARDSGGAFEGRVDYHPETRQGRFDITSTLDVPTLLDAWMGIPRIPDVELRGRQWVEAEGDFLLANDAPPRLRVTGHTRCDSLTLRGIPFDSLETFFSWRDGNLYLRDLHLARPDGRVEAKAMIQGPAVRLALRTTLPVSHYRPLFEGQFLEHVIDRCGESDESSIDLTLDGGFHLENRHAWAFSGEARGENFTFNGVPLDSAASRFALSHHELDFFEGTATFDYSRYPLRQTFNGPRGGTARIARIRYDTETRSITVNGISGTVWAAPVVRLFAPDIADTLEVYRFHHPPELSANGLIDLDDKGETSLQVAFRSNHPASYEFLGKDITLLSPSGKVDVGGSSVTVAGLTCGTHGGTLSGNITRRHNGRLEGEFNWAGLSLPAVADTYDFNIKGGGTLTGRLDFSLLNGDITTMGGNGLIALEQTRLFSVPLFGPLSSLVSNVLSDKKNGFDGAKDAFFSFTIQDGILSTDDFRTSNSSLNLTGDGRIDLSDRTVDVTMRMNARGFLGLITLPLRPFYGLFQFRGTGPLQKPEWESVLFTSPAEVQRKALLAPPKARMVEE